MSNVNAPFGFLPFTGTIGGVSPNFSLATEQIAYNDSTAIYTGDPIQRLATGYVAQWTAGTAVSQLAGIFMGAHWRSNSTGQPRWSNYWPGSDAASTDVVTCYFLPLNLTVPGTFLVQTDATGAAFADIGINVDVALGTGTAANGRSGAYLNMTSTTGTTATLPFRILDLASKYLPPGSPGTATGAYNWVVVAANVSGAGSTGLTT